MGRIHLFEFEDLKWFPAFLRNYGTDFLRFVSNKTKMYKPVVPIIEKALKQSHCSKIVDLGSGGGGGLLWLNSKLVKFVPDLQITLTDYYPNISAFEYIKKQESNINFVAKPVDARDVPHELTGFRTQFLSLHHFKPNDAKQILQNAVDSKNSIGVFEFQERSLLSILAMVFSPFMVLLTTPFIRPFSIRRIIFTYLIPIVPLFVLWDGLVSSLRTYSVEEMKELVAGLKNTADFIWKINRINAKPGVVLYLVGIPNDNLEIEITKT